MNPWRARSGGAGALFAALLLAGIGLRAWRVGQPDLWGDEILYLRMCRPEMSAGQVVDAHLSSYKYIGHLPSTAILTNLGLKLQGVRTKDQVTPLNARLPSVVMGGVTLALLALWVFQLSGSRLQALLALGITAFSFVHIWYSREAYYYPGELLYAALVLVTGTPLLRGGLGRGRAAALIGLHVGSVIGLAFSHPSGISLLAVTGLYALGLALWRERRGARLYAVAAVDLAAVALTLLSAGTGQEKNPWIDTYRFPAWMVALDLVRSLMLGAGAWRTALSLALGVAGTAVILRGGSGRTRWMVLAVPVMFAMVQLGGRNLHYSPKYFFLLWPFLVWAQAAALDRLISAAAQRWRTLAAAAAIALLAANVAPGLAKLYPLRGKSDLHATLRDTMDRELAPGTICVWEAGHALRFIPDFITPKKPLFFGALQGLSAQNYLSGAVQGSLAALRERFPLSAYVEWHGMSSFYDRQIMGTNASPARFQAELTQIFTRVAEVGDPALAALFRSGWLADSLPRQAPDFEQRLSTTLDCLTMRLYFAVPEAMPDPAWPLFDPQSWQLALQAGSAPIMLGAPEAALKLLFKEPSAAARLRVQAVGFQPGRLTVSAGRRTLAALEFGAAGATREATFEAEPEAWYVFRYQLSGAPLPNRPWYGLLKLRTEPAGP